MKYQAIDSNLFVENRNKFKNNLIYWVTILTVPLFGNQSDKDSGLFYVDFQKKIQRFFISQQSCDSVTKLLETLERKTTFLRLVKTLPIEPSVYLLFQSSHSSIQ